ncbi:MAG: ATP-binding protein [Planctomycetaceae bacterium]|nr:ATP-binding protein [Planctomycetaceae bacterium]
MNIGLVSKSWEIATLVTDAARALGADVVPVTSVAADCDCVLIDATGDDDVVGGSCETPCFLIVSPVEAEGVAQRLRVAGHGIVRTTAAVLDLDHALRLTAALADAPPRAVRLPPLLVRAELCHRLPNDPTLASVWGAELRREAVERLGCPTETAFRLASAAAEAVENAMLRGNLEISPALSDAGDAAMVAQLVETRRRQNPFRERSVWASCRFSTEDIRVVVRDEGPGFASAPDWPAGVTAPLLGRGGLILRALCDDVRYNADGNEVTLLIALSSPSAAPAVRTAVDRVPLTL